MQATYGAAATRDSIGPNGGHGIRLHRGLDGEASVEGAKLLKPTARRFATGEIFAKVPLAVLNFLGINFSLQRMLRIR